MESSDICMFYIVLYDHLICMFYDIVLCDHLICMFYDIVLCDHLCCVLPGLPPVENWIKTVINTMKNATNNMDKLQSRLKE